MKHVNGDMEDLFRRASPKYPLRTDSADWDRLAAALDKDPGPPSITDKDDKRRRRVIFWWWLLLPLAVGLGIYNWRATVRPSAHLTKSAAQPGEPSAGGTDGARGQTETQRGETSSGETQRAETGNETGPSGVIRPAATGGMKSAGAPAGGSSAEKRQPTGSTAKAGGTGRGDVTHDDLFDAAGKNMTGVKGKFYNSDAGDPAMAKLNWQKATTSGSFRLVVDVKVPAAWVDSSAEHPKKATAKSKGGHGYIGITGAPDLSTVKMQATKDAGTTWGLVLGYAFNSRWAVESGVYLDRKKYYTAGEYFKGETLPLYTNLQSVNGSCNMWEIPLNIRYNFNPGSKVTWFATAGFSSYFMTRQKYSVIEESGGVTWPDSWIDSAHASYLFSIINLSGGFEQRIGRIGNLRIEPYLRIPLSGIGAGRLPIMSAGLNIGITRQLW